ncbi:hypothetical protein EI94DRAFT_1885272 [Lactarius quietus]|nr:hypothetical protein EI94DRAFT_1818859 [Lactarius quietus]KAF8262407.1 hypothetical protein EI94DRAFT_1885272 [Lactarius quietus]
MQKQGSQSGRWAYIGKMPPRRPAPSTPSESSPAARTPPVTGSMPPPPVPSKAMPPPPIPGTPTAVNERDNPSPSDGAQPSKYSFLRRSTATPGSPLQSECPPSVKTEPEEICIAAQDAAMRSPSPPIQESTDDERATPAAPPRITRTSFLHRRKVLTPAPESPESPEIVEITPPPVHAGASRAPPPSKDAAKVERDRLQHIENTKKLIEMCETVEGALSEAYTELLNIKKYAENVKDHYEADL